jgi:hypothetical protein
MPRVEAITRVIFAGLAALACAALCAGCAGRPAGAAAPGRGQGIIGGWNLVTPGQVRAAAADGVNTAFLFGRPPAPDSALGQAFTAAHMHIISAQIAAEVSRYECTRTHTISPPPAADRPYCARNPRVGRGQLLAAVSNIITRDATSPLVAGYWVLDDVPGWDTGGLRDALVAIHAMLPRGRAAICGFAAHLDTAGTYRWDTRLAANVSAHGCDFVAPYVYALPRPPGSPTPPGIDWSMRRVLPAMEASLAAYGWNPAAQPMLGVAQAWGGLHSGDQAIEYPPTVTDMTRQARAYCAGGAAGIVWYAWTLTGYPAARTPATDTALNTGIQQAVRACGNMRHVWPGRWAGVAGTYQG